MYPKNYYFFRDTSAPAQARRNGLSDRMRNRGTGALVAGLAAAILVAGCFSRDPMRLQGSGLPGDDSAGKPSAAHTQDAAEAAAAPVTDDPDLDRLWQKRSSELSSTKDYPIGPGDVLTISVPQMDELQERKVRVTPQGTIELPLVGAVQAGGMTEEQLEAGLDQKLNNFMYNPQAAVYVNEYHNRSGGDWLGKPSRPRAPHQSVGDDPRRGDAGGRAVVHRGR